MPEIDQISCFKQTKLLADGVVLKPTVTIVSYFELSWFHKSLLGKHLLDQIVCKWWGLNINCGHVFWDTQALPTLSRWASPPLSPGQEWNSVLSSNLCAPWPGAIRPPRNPLPGPLRAMGNTTSTRYTRPQPKLTPWAQSSPLSILPSYNSKWE